MAGSAVIGSLRVVLGIDTAMFDKGLADAMKSLKGIGKSMQSAGKTMSAALTAPILGFGALTLKTAGAFEASMNRVAAATGATGAEFQALETLARDLGRSTSKSASESADMLEMLAKNGLSAEQILGGAAEAAIKLSEATGGELSRSADVATNVMAQFGLEAKDLAKVVDQITAVTLDSQFGFDDYALALGQAGGVAGALGVELTEFNAVIAATSDVFNSGSDAGTSFKSFLTRLVPASDAAAATMEELGLKFFEADGSMKSMSAIAGELQTKMAGLSDENMNAALKDIFGVDAMRTAVALMNQGASGIDAATASINRKGIADQQAAARMAGLNGEMEKLAGAFEDLQIAFADSGLLALVTEFVTKLAEWVQSLAEANPELLKWGTIIAGVAAALGPLVLALGVVATGIAAIGAPVALVIAGLAGLTAAVIAFWPEIQNLASIVTAFVAGAWAQFVAAWDGMVAKVHAVKDSIVQFVTEIPAIFANLASQMMEIGAQIMDGLWQGIKGKFAQVKDGIAGFASGLVDSVKSTLGIHSPSRVMYEVGTNVMQGLSDGMTSMQGGISNIAGSIGSTISSAFQGVIDGTKSVKEAISDVMKSLTSMMLDASFKMLIGAIFGGGGGGLDPWAGLRLPGFARGGSILPGGAGGIDSQVVAFRKSPNERVDITKPGQRLSSGGADVKIEIINNTPAQVRQERERGGDGTEIRRFILDTVKQGMATGDLDQPNKARFGASPMKVLR
ncbi:phage tail tape measure protein, TP901 family, core region [Aminobacter sp. MSH1]|uniref:phage tail tape measure protein n=1 Tax=Aminobacter sp. MSH1 TaxID=374606 RepID=UPI000D3B803A|nr:phage tail tape measure protein [Aminobacter sp. MSH1]AWC25450.1 phage tail tape measure protein, TP901 family, core region [Aminobacter sp. MSH1]